MRLFLLSYSELPEHRKCISFIYVSLGFGVHAVGK